MSERTQATIDRVAERLFPDDPYFHESVRQVLICVDTAVAEVEATHGPAVPDGYSAFDVGCAWAIIAAIRFRGNLEFAAKARRLLTEFAPGTFPDGALDYLLPVALSPVQVLELVVLGDAVEAAGATPAVHREVAALIRYIVTERITRAQFGGLVTNDERRRSDLTQAFAACLVYEMRDRCLPGFPGREALEAAGVEGLPG